MAKEEYQTLYGPDVTHAFDIFEVDFEIDNGGNEYQLHGPFLIGASDFEDALKVIRSAYASQLSECWSIKRIEKKHVGFMYVSPTAHLHDGEVV